MHTGNSLFLDSDSEQFPYIFRYQRRQKYGSLLKTSNDIEIVPTALRIRSSATIMFFAKGEKAAQNVKIKQAVLYFLLKYFTIFKSILD